jgi:hypothetical protein
VGAVKLRDGTLLTLLCGSLAGMALGAIMWFWIDRALPVRYPVLVSGVHSELKPNHVWRVSETLDYRDDCELLVIERRFKDEVLNDWYPAQPVDSFPAYLGGGISRVVLQPGKQPAWAEYRVTETLLQKGIYTVTLTATRCKSGFDGIYQLIPAEPYDFTSINGKSVP